MLTVELDDEAWGLWKRSWALWGVRTNDELIKFLEIHMRESSTDVLNSAEEMLISDEPEALARREIGLMKERQKKRETTDSGRRQPVFRNL